MRLQISKSKNAESFYVIRSVNEKGKRTNIVYEKLGTLKQVTEKANGKDPYQWAKEYVQELTKKEKEQQEESVVLELSTRSNTAESNRAYYEAGHVFLQKMFYRLGWNKLSGKLKEGTNHDLPLNGILQMLLYTRIINPGSKKASWEAAKNYLPGVREERYQLHQVYRALDLFAEKTDLIQELVYKSTEKVFSRNTDVLYYDCTNFFFEIEEEDEFRRYGHSKENRPNPIVQMGMFIDGDGIPLAVSVFPGNQSEQKSMKPLEETILKDFDLSRFIVCTDSGLASKDNRIFNSRKERRYVVTQSLKTLSAPVQEWALEPKGWKNKEDRSGKLYDISKIDELQYRDSIFYKEQTVDINGLPQRFIVTYSVRSKDYQRKVRQRQIDRAVKTVTKHPGDMDHNRQTDYKRLIQMSFFTEEGEVSSVKQLNLDTEAIAREERFDGFYGVCTNLFAPSDEHPEGVDTLEILRINHMRWQIEDCFRDMKTEFRSRPVYLSRENRIKAHFLLCALSLILLKYVEKSLRDKGFRDFTTEQLLEALRSFHMVHLKGFGYIPAFQPSSVLQHLSEVFSLLIDAQIISDRQMKNFLSVSR